MKKLLIFLLILFPGSLLAQDNHGGEKWPILPTLPAREGKIYYEEVVELKPSVAKDSLYKAARQWLAGYSDTAKLELQVDEREAGQLIARGNHHYQFFVRENMQEVGPNEQEKPYVIHLQHTLHIEVKDGQYRFRIYDFSARDEIRDLMITDELNPAQGQVPEPRVRRSARSKKKREEMFMVASYRSKLLAGLEDEVKDLTKSFKSAMAKAESSD
jgi:hypothetical protein